MSTKDTKQLLIELVEKYKEALSNEKMNVFSEADVTSKFILPFLEVLGWETGNIDEVREQKMTLTGPADFSINVNKRPAIVIEIKKFTENLDGYRTVRGKRETFPEQAIYYAWHLKTNWVILTNFTETRLYYSHVKKPADGLIFSLKWTDYLKDIDRLMILSKDSVYHGSLNKLEHKRERIDVDKAFLNDLLSFRLMFVEDVRRNNLSYSIDNLRESVQKIMDRLVVIRVAEDKSIIGADSLWLQLDAWKNRGLKTPFMRSLKSIFRDFDEIYNSKLFAADPCEDLIIDNSTLEKVIEGLYDYNFDLIGADILGAIYEDYLGHTLNESGDNVKVVQDQSKRKAGGVYYTPIHIVDYVLRQTLGVVLRQVAVNRIKDLKILDPSCGSGSFLIKALDVIDERYRTYLAELQNKIHTSGNLSSMINETVPSKKEILMENIFGVDLDSQAAEVAAVNLMLKTLTRDEKLPQLLGENIKVGNSLISGANDELSKYFDNIEKEKPFDWASEFKEIHDNGGFDIIVGNPPHGAKLTDEERTFFKDKYPISKGNLNTASLFIEKAYSLLKDGGVMGLVIPKSLTYSEKWNAARQFILEKMQIIEIVDLSKAFQDVLLEQIVLICKKGTPVNQDYTYIGTSLLDENKKVSHNISSNLCATLDILPIHVSEKDWRIFHKIGDRALFLREITKTFRGLPIQSVVTDDRNSNEPLLIGDDIKRYYHIPPHKYVCRELLKEGEKIALMRNRKIISQRIIAHILKPKDHLLIMSTLDVDGYLNVDTIENTVLTDRQYDYRYILAFLNSHFISWFAYTFIFNKAIRTMDLDDSYMGKMPIFKMHQSGSSYEKSYEHIINLVDRLLSFYKEKNEMIIDFQRYLEPVNAMVDLDFYLNNLCVKEIIKDVLTKGEIKKFIVTIENDWLKFTADYLTEEDTKKERKEVMKCCITDEILRQFLFHSLRTFGKVSGKGTIYYKIWRARCIPQFDVDSKANYKQIKTILGKYSPIFERHNQIENECKKLEFELNNEIYALFGLNESDVEYLEDTYKS